MSFLGAWLVTTSLAYLQILLPTVASIMLWVAPSVLTLLGFVLAIWGLSLFALHNTRYSRRAKSNGMATALKFGLQVTITGGVANVATSQFGDALGNTAIGLLCGGALGALISYIGEKLSITMEGVPSKQLLALAIVVTSLGLTISGLGIYVGAAFYPR